MTDATKPRPTGDAAYRANKEAIARRNDEVRKAGKAQRQAEEKRAAQRRMARDLQEREELSAS